MKRLVSFRNPSHYWLVFPLWSDILKFFEYVISTIFKSMIKNYFLWFQNLCWIFNNTFFFILTCWKYCLSPINTFFLNPFRFNNVCWVLWSRYSTWGVRPSRLIVIEPPWSYIRKSASSTLIGWITSSTLRRYCFTSTLKSISWVYWWFGKSLFWWGYL